MSPWSNRKPILGQRSALIKQMTPTSYKLDPTIWSHGTGQRITWFDRCQLIITWCHISKKYKEIQGCMSLSTYYLEYGRHLAQLHCRCQCRAFAPTNNTASHDNHDKINSWVSMSSLYGYGAPLGDPLGCRSSAIKLKTGQHRIETKQNCCKYIFIIWTPVKYQVNIHMKTSYLDTWK